MELSIEIIDEIEVLEQTSFKELDYIKEHDWTKLKSRDSRKQQQEFIYKIIKRNLEDAQRFYKLASNNLDNPKVDAVIKNFGEFLTIYVERFEKYKKLHDWAKYSDSATEGKRKADVQDEMTFQNGIIRTITEFKGLWRKIDSGGSTGSLDLNIFNDTPIPIIFESLISERHPEVVSFLETRRIKEDARKEKEKKNGK